MDIESIVERAKLNNPSLDTGFIEKAYLFAKAAHEGQQRASGEEYLQHPLSVAYTLSELGMDEIGIAAALLHDVVEDTEVSLEQITEEFGSTTALLVDGVTKLGRLEYRSQVEAQASNLRKMFLAMAEDLRVILIRLADRLHNMQTLSYLPEDRQKRIAEETMEIFAPLAHRLGIWSFKWQLEDLAFSYLEPEEFAGLSSSIQSQRAEREAYINRVIELLNERLADAGIQADIQGRAKHLYSIWRKMRNDQKQLSEIFDLLAVRVIVDSIRDCYAVLGLVHSYWKPIPGRFKDFIAMPKANMYQSLHTTVIGPEGEPFEIQIRTPEMHKIAEYGIAAHWRYKEGNSRADADFERKIAWLRQVLEWDQDGDPREFMESLKIDLFHDEVFVFTPQGDVVDLPAGATPIDFAYAIHTDVGHRCVGAKVNGRIVPLEYKVKNGDIIEILTNKSSSGPSLDWLKLAQTSGARNRIRQWFKRQRRDENVARGKDMLDREIKRFGYDSKEVLDPAVLSEILRRYNLPDMVDLQAAIGFGGVSAQQVTTRLYDEAVKQKKALPVVELPPEFHKPSFGKPTEGVRVRGVDNVLLKLAKCCNPLPGDPIIGYITRGRGVSVHRMNCSNVIAYSKEPERLIEVAWDEEVVGLFTADLIIGCTDRPGILAELVGILADMRINILSARATVSKDRKATINLSLEIRNLGQLEMVVNRFERVRDVISVSRVSRETRL